MKKLFCLLLAFVFVFGLCACEGKTDNESLVPSDAVSENEETSYEDTSYRVDYYYAEGFDDYGECYGDDTDKKGLLYGYSGCLPPLWYYELGSYKIPHEKGGDLYTEAFYNEIKSFLINEKAKVEARDKPIRETDVLYKTFDIREELPLIVSLDFAYPDTFTCYWPKETKFSYLLYNKTEGYPSISVTITEGKKLSDSVIVQSSEEYITGEGEFEYGKYYTKTKTRAENPYKVFLMSFEYEEFLFEVVARCHNQAIAESSGLIEDIIASIRIENLDLNS